MAKKLSYGTEARKKMAKGAEKLAKAVKVTLGPKGRTVVIEKSFGAPRTTKDGVSVAKEIELADKFENLGAQMIKEVASRTNDVAGDGTTTSIVLAEAIIHEGIKSVAAGINPMDLKRGIDIAVAEIVKELTKMSKKVSNPEEIAQVATISANGDNLVGQKIAEAVQKVGAESPITVEEAKGLEFEVNVVEPLVPDIDIAPDAFEFVLGVNVAVYLVPDVAAKLVSVPPVHNTNDKLNNVVDVSKLNITTAVCPIIRL